MRTYDSIYYWIGTTRYGRWHHVRQYSPRLLTTIHRRGYPAIAGYQALGTPRQPPHPQLFSTTICLLALKA